ncbi:orotate phosphoribosyltransferase [Bacillaceae bacterium S4-13-58]
MKTTRMIARALLEIGAVQVNPSEPFVWSSGMLSPIYCDNRKTMGHPELRKKIADSFVQTVEEKFPQVELIAGTSTAGIPHAAWVSDQLDLPMCYVRDKAKGHGRKNQIEGVYHEGQKVVVIEDLISTGKSSINVVKALQEAGCEVLGVVAIFTYGLPAARESFAEHQLPYETLTNFHTLLEILESDNVLTQEQIEQIQKWIQNPKEYQRVSQ